jgi:hypothetical protein
MADRILVWYVDKNTGNGTNEGPSFIMDRDYVPYVVRTHAKNAPDAGNMEITINDDGASIFSSPVFLPQNENTEEVVEDWVENATTIEKYSLVTLDLNPNGAQGITVQLELDAVENEETERSDT